MKEKKENKQTTRKEKKRNQREEIYLQNRTGQYK